MEIYNSPTKGKLQRCWCWIYSEELKDMDNGFRPAGEDYPHAEVYHAYDLEN